MDTLNRLFGKRKMSDGKEVGKAIHGGRSRTIPKLVTVLSMLAFLLLLSSVTLPSAGFAAFPGANGKIAFTSNRHDVNGYVQVYLMDADGSNQTRLTFASGNDGEAAWSPDGTKIAFDTNRSPAPGNEQRIWVMDADGSNPIMLTTFNSGRPSWSPDGTKIAFFGVIVGDAEIFVMDADGSNQTRLTFSAGDDAHPSWSPDGSKIAFFSRRDENAEIYVMDADGSNQTRLTTTIGATEWYPDWSPDGAKIAFMSSRDGDFEIYVMNADGSNQTRLTFNASDDWNPAWSPDGTKILFHSDRDGDQEIFAMNADGSGQTQLTTNSAFDCCANWQPIPPMSVAIDIKPGSFPNSINPKSKGNIPVAILTTEDFDATTVDPLSVEFGPYGATESHGRGHIEDVDGDGDDDLVLHFRTQDTGIQCGDTSASLTGETFGGQMIEGSDSINTVGCK
jgi:dipeptidyl aminopeptidase/acylaminoacyl peptidase